MNTIMKINGIEIDFHKMEVVCGTHEHDFLPLVQAVYPHAKLYTPTDGRQLIYVDNGASLISVCHLDGTMPANHFYYGPVYDKKDMVVFSPFVDDRIGAYIQLFVYPQLGIKADLLFSEGEETGETTAGFFNQPNRQYNWMFEFDRMGTDAVHYQYMDRKWLNALDKHFDAVTPGMFSDIGAMDHLGCQGVNIGCGYYDYTRVHGWCSMKDMTSQCQKFLKFYNEYKDIYFPYTRPKQQSRYNINSLFTRPTARTRKAKILKVRHITPEPTVEDIGKKIAGFNQQTVAERTVNEAIKERVRAVAAEVASLIEVDEPVRELIPEAPIPPPEDTTLPEVKLLPPANKI